MTPREKLIYLITNYNKGNYTTSDFCDLFIEYHRDLEKEELSDSLEKWFDDLSEMCHRFSDFSEDLSIPNVYFDEKQMKEYTSNFPSKFI